MMRAPTFELNFSSTKYYKISGIFKMGTEVGRYIHNFRHFQRTNTSIRVNAQLLLLPGGALIGCVHYVPWTSAIKQVFTVPTSWWMAHATT
jgi:hypothetical protein